MSKRDDELVDESNDSPLQRRLRNLWHDNFDEQAFIEEAEALVKSDRTALLDQLVMEMPKKMPEDYFKRNKGRIQARNQVISEVTALLNKAKGDK